MFLVKYDGKIINIPYRNVYQRTWKLVDCKIYNSSTRGKSIQNQSTTPFGRCGLTLDWFTTCEIVIDFAIHQLLGPLISTVLWYVSGVECSESPLLFNSNPSVKHCTVCCIKLRLKSCWGQWKLQKERTIEGWTIKRTRLLENSK